jgi:hypothetical protein
MRAHVTHTFKVRESREVMHCLIGFIFASNNNFFSSAAHKKTSFKSGKSAMGVDKIQQLRSSIKVDNVIGY